MSDELRTIAAWLMLLLPIPPLAVLVMVIEHVWSDNMALRERTGIAIRDTLVSGIVALLSANYLFGWNLNTSLLVVLLMFGLSALSVPSLIWLVIYFRSGFR